ncbi:MAG TPA: ester cyclase [Gaiellaceae bacterium]
MSEAKRVLEQAIEYWNAGDREAWTTLYAEDVVYEAPGGQRITGLADLKEKYFDALLTAAPDRASRDAVLIADGEYVVEQARYVGTHTGPLRNPDGAEVPVTGKPFDFPFVGIFHVQSGKIRSIRIYYDQLELLMQLGLIPGATPT